MTEKDAILEFRSVTFHAEPGQVLPLTGFDLAVSAGETVFIHYESHAQSVVPVGDLAEGLLVPDSGTVSFMGTDWQDLEPIRQSRARGRIGRVFDQHAWISNLTVHENIVLAMRHHSDLPDSEIEERAAALAEKAGLRDLCDQRPEFVKQIDLQKAQWVRAFLSGPALVLLERPTADVPRDAVVPLADLIAAASARGAAVVWQDSDSGLPGKLGVRISKKYRLADDGSLSAMEVRK